MTSDFIWLMMSSSWLGGSVASVCVMASVAPTPGGSGTPAGRFGGNVIGPPPAPMGPAYAVPSGACRVLARTADPYARHQRYFDIACATCLIFFVLSTLKAVCQARSPPYILPVLRSIARSSRRASHWSCALCLLFFSSSPACPGVASGSYTCTPVSRGR